MLGLYLELSLQLQQSVMCCQAKSLHEFLAYANYCSDYCVAKNKLTKEKLMFAQTEFYKQEEGKDWYLEEVMHSFRVL